MASIDGVCGRASGGAFQTMIRDLRQLDAKQLLLYFQHLLLTIVFLSNLAQKDIPCSLVSICQFSHQYLQRSYLTVPQCRFSGRTSFCQIALEMLNQSAIVRPLVCQSHTRGYIGARNLSGTGYGAYCFHQGKSVELDNGFVNRYSGINNRSNRRTEDQNIVEY